MGQKGLSDKYHQPHNRAWYMVRHWTKGAKHGNLLTVILGGGLAMTNRITNGGEYFSHTMSFIRKLLFE